MNETRLKHHQVLVWTLRMFADLLRSEHRHVRHTLLCKIILAAVIAVAYIGPVRSQSAKNPYYPVVQLPDQPDAIALIDKIDFRTPLSFEKAFSKANKPNVLILDSPGGHVQSALTIALWVKQRGMKTVIPEGAVCASACSFIFFAGAQRYAYGKLGVHQVRMSSGEDNLVAGQWAVGDIIDVLQDFDVPGDVLALMLRTPPNDMYFLSPEENRRFGFLGGTGGTRLEKPQNKDNDERHEASFPGPRVGRPSFNCDWAKTPQEITICMSPSLANADFYMAQQYQQVQASAHLSDAAKARLKDEQLAWVRSRDRTCNAMHRDLSDPIAFQNLVTCLDKETVGRYEYLKRY